MSEVVDALLGPGGQRRKDLTRGDRRDDAEAGGDVRRLGRPTLGGAAIAQVHDDPHIRLDQCRQRLADDRDGAQRRHDRQVFAGNNPVIGQGRMGGVGQMNSRFQRLRRKERVAAV